MNTELAVALSHLDWLPLGLESLRSFYGENNALFKFAEQIQPFAKVEAEQLCVWAEEGNTTIRKLSHYKYLRCLRLLEQIKPVSFNELIELTLSLSTDSEFSAKERIELIILHGSLPPVNNIDALDGNEWIELLSLICLESEISLLDYLLEINLIGYLLELPETNPAFIQEEFNEACSRGNIDVVKRLLSVCDPSVGNNSAISFAAESGHVAVVSLLLADPRVDPSGGDNNAILIASENGHEAVVALLLADPRVNPSAGYNYAIRIASANGHVAVVALLLDDPRVNPSDKHNYAIRIASANGYQEIVKMIKADKRCTLNFIQKIFY